jgi:hypothetical protein
MKIRTRRVRPHLLLLACLLFLDPASALAASFSYSYEYDSGAVLTGTLDGDVNGDQIENITSITAFYQSVELGNGALVPSLTAVASFSGNTMNLEGNGFSGGGLPEGFSLLVGGIPVVLQNGGLVEGFPGAPVYDPGSWTIVPEPATGLMLLSGTLALAAARRQYRT